MKPRAETLEQRRERYTRYTELRRQGMTQAQIAAAEGITQQAVHAVLRYARGAWTPPSPAPDRPAWSYPDDALLQLAREGRAEIEAALRARVAA